jgi:hypothetical protein
MLIKRRNLISNNLRMCKICHKLSNSKKQWGGYGEISGHKWAVIKRNAIVRKLKFEISIKYAWELFLKQEKRCALSGVLIGFKLPLILSLAGDRGEDTASIDRIDSTKGYTENNIQWIHKDIQKMKWNYDQEYFLNMCRQITKNKGAE